MKYSKKIFILIFATCMMVGSMIGMMKWGTNKEIKLIIHNEEIKGYAPPLVENTEIYLPFEVIKDHIYQDMFLNTEENRMYIHMDDEMNINIPTKKIDDHDYVPIKLLEKLLGISVDYDKKYIVAIDKSFMDIKDVEKNIFIQRKPFSTHGKNINIAWEYVYEESKDISGEDKIHSLDVLVPTWFSIIDHKGTVKNKGDKEYVFNAHKKGYKVWGLVDNSFDPKITSSILNDTNIRNKVIDQILIYADLYELDGINIDFENVYYKDQKALVDFIKELSQYTKKKNIVLSMDVTVPSSSEQWSKVYDRKSLSKIVDYIAVMAYDEHWASSPVSGSVASIGWVEKGIQNSLEYIPKEKILLGLPFYTRIWKEYDGKVESKSISMTYAKKIIEEKNASVSWNEEVGQYYAQYEEDGIVYKIWLEDPRSIALKLSLVKKYDLAGTGSWRRGFEAEEVWMVLQKMTKDQKTYAQLGY
ncbi:glycosyl hydrolase family 18 protein [Inediibacterium massiliense]|uniref:glycosyl hydrolase family 18 protein n=1 Tax=Inediibacterium massiliense TaxID=1658111 RepID=UPI0006B4CB93|nr:glycosyl hydrolase family 18 protein [Inediibacterium massiliense]